MLNLIISRTGYGKTTYIKEKIKELTKEKKYSVLIIPEQISFESERDILNAVGAKDLKYVSVMSFTRMCSLFFSEYGGREKPYIDSIGKTAIMEETLNYLKPTLNLFSKTALTPRFCELMIELDSNCKKNSVTADKLAELSNENNGILKEKLNETSLILSEFQSALNKDYFDPLDDLSYVTDKVGETDFFKDKTVFIDSFTGFTLQQLEFIKKIMPISNDLYISLGFDGVYSNNEFSTFQNISKQALDLKVVAKESGIKVGSDIVLTENRRSKFEDLDFLEKNIFSNEENTYPEAPENITVTATRNIYEEAEYVAKKILNLIKDDNIRFRDISVISRDSEEYNGIIDEVFERYEIPVFVDNRETVENFSLFKLIMFSLSAVEKKFDFDSIISIVKTGIIGLDENEASLFELYCNVWRINKNEFEEEFSLPVDGFLNGDEQYFSECSEIIENARKKVIEPLVEFRKTAGKTVKSIVSAIFNLIKNYNCGVNLKQKAQSLFEKGYIRLSENTARSYDILIHILDQFYLSVGDREVTLKRFTEIFSSAIASLNIGSVPQGLDAVAVGSAERMRPKSPKVTFIIGANEGVFPSSKSGSGLFSDDELRALKEKGVNLPFFDVDTAIDEQYLAYCALCSPSEKLFVSYCLSSMSSEEKAESLIVTDLKRIFPKMEIVTYDNTEIATVNDALRYYSKKKGKDLEIAEFFKNHFDERFERLNLSLNNGIDNLSETTAKSLYGSVLSGSASRIEVYNKCNFYYFCKYGLKARPIRQAVLDNLNRGTLVHYVLEKMVENYSVEDFKKLSDGEVDEKVGEYFTENLKTVISDKKQTEIELFRLRKLREMITEMVKRVFEELEHSEFVAAKTELSIGTKDADIKPLKFDFGNGEIVISGKVDRVDIADKESKRYLRIIDYKTYDNKLDLSKMIYGQGIQMPLYMKAVIDNGKEKFGDCSPAGMFYMNAQDITVDYDNSADKEEMKKERLKKLKLSGMLLDEDENIYAFNPKGENDLSPVVCTGSGKIAKSTPSYSQKQYEIMSEYLEKMIKDNANDIISGKIKPNPTEKESEDACKYCDYFDICKFTEKHIKIKSLASTDAFTIMLEKLEKEEER